ncbi:MAG: V-type ATP synthase subunit D [Elusimicrobia bacterium]|nr:V-type ATP synthase subunit D [Elusimicrobiota bacterium]
MRLSVNPTRMELQRLKKTLQIARRGWKLLKDKQDELMKNFLEKKDIFFEEYEKLNKEIKKIFSLAVLGDGFLSPEQTEKLAKKSEAKISVKMKQKILFGVTSAEFDVQKSANPINYKKSQSVLYWDRAVELLNENIEKILKVGALLFEIRSLCEEIASTRRRVNSLEYRMIPDLIETIKFINFKLEEMERANTVRLMKVKDIVRRH